MNTTAVVVGGSQQPADLFRELLLPLTLRHGMLIHWGEVTLLQVFDHMVLAQYLKGSKLISSNTCPHPPSCFALQGPEATWRTST